MTSSQEIIDLTESPPLEPIVIDSDEDDAKVDNLTRAEQGKAPRKKRRSRKKMSVESGEVAESSNQGPNSRKSNTELIWDPPERQRSRSPGSRRRSPKPRDEFGDLFYVDLKPAPVHIHPTKPHGDSVASGELDKPKLLLPEHVSVFGLGEGYEGPVEIIRPPSPSSEKEAFIEYLDYDDRNKDLVRYFDEVAEDTKPARFVCKNCGAEGEHKTAECPVQICLTCGARNEHSTRSCPISKTCFTCGMKGHIVQNCPNRYSRRSGGMGSYDDCDRCGATTHKTNECPTWWRIYEYVSDEERLGILQEREAKQQLRIGQGGEGYIGSDACCYNCGGVGHWGDDCNEVPHLWDFPREPSAFSTHNIMLGPFFDPDVEPSGYTAGYHGGDNDLPTDWGMGAPGNVGKKGRKKDKAKMQERFYEQEANSDAEDWFGNPKNVRSSGKQPAMTPNRGPPRGPKKMTFGLSIKDAARQLQLHAPPESPTLLSRIGDGPDRRSNDRSRDDDGRGPSRPSGASIYRGSREEEYTSRDYNGRGRGQDRRQARSEGDSRKDRGRERRYSRQQEPGPRYTGGYSR